ncbi:DUF3488 and transglutaminase-like domain-containing protein [Vogesella sp. LIG4]|uniref:transglutaminase family protein n=1 Tax=Vogesella sp. LIG4 TaxID=1192162 RepID=UPI00082016F5|nr:DUF3488 and transglutaminase-like domain-containing protein [Vogesella sp. LIG4]SCK07888.1 Transglutaminase-like enzyme, putative cysteine protease [Vogesella sp. LIG4]
MPADDLRRAGLTVLAALWLTALPLGLWLPFWVLPLCSVLLAWCALLLWQQRPLPSRWLLLPLVLGSVLFLWFSLRTLVGREGGVAFLLLLLAGKALETRNLRDWRVLLALCFFLASTPLLFEQGPLAAAWLVFSLFLLSWAMVLLAGEEARISPRLAARTLLLSFPLMLVLFVAMPRLPGPLWSMPAQDQRATTGLADSMSPGSVGRMIPSREPAFTAQFFGRQPRPAELYWRVMVFDQFDGGTWSAGFLPYSGSSQLPAAQPPLRYDVVAEPYRGLLPQLEQVSEVGEGVRLVSQQRLRRNDENNNSRLRYRASSYASDYYLEALSPRLQQFYTRLPAGNPQTLAAGRQLAQLYPEQERRLLALQRWLQAQGLRYTLTPPVLQDDSVDGFLFGSHQGFCEHFSSAFTVLARAAGLPARVVVGFQGGEYNAGSNFWLVRSSDAHAWSEVWLAGRWQRVDPTALVAPQRSALGIEQALPAAAAAMPVLGGRPPGWARWLGQQWQAANFGWQRWVVGYDAERQRSLFQQLGLADVSVGSVMLVFAGGMLLVLLPLAGWLLWRPRRASSPGQAGWQQLLRRLRRAGVRAADSDTASQLLQKAQGLAAADYRQLQLLLAQWQRWQYAPAGQDEAARQWRLLLRRFHPRRQP